MTKGATVIVSLALFWGAGCGTNSAIGNLHTGGAGGNDGIGGAIAGLGGAIAGLGGQNEIGGSGAGGDMLPGTGGSGAGGFATGGAPGSGGSGIGGQRGSCPGQVIPPMTGLASFALQPPVDYSTGAGAYAVAAADLNRDGKLDLVLLDYSVGVRVMLNNGNGTFGNPVNHAIAGPTAASAVATGDLNGDGKIDIATVSPDGVSVILNQGNGNFGPPVTYVVGTGSNRLAIGDLNQDGRPDIAVTDVGTANGADIAVLMNTGSGTFTVMNYPLAQIPEAIAIGDLDNDCAPDLVVGGDSGLTVLLNGFGGFQTLGSFANGTTSTTVSIADLNGDGQLDLVEGSGTNSVSDAAYVLFNQGNASLTAPIRYGAPLNPSGTPSTLSVVLADMNRDARSDILAYGSCCGFSVMLNQGDGTFGAAKAYSVPDFPVSAAVGDFNGDGLADVAVVSSNFGGGTSNLRVMLNGSH